jgi:hypothetical protein
MMQQIRRLLYGPSTRLRLASSGSITIRQVVTPSPPCTNLQKAILILWFIVLTALHVVWMDNAIAADPNVPDPILILRQPDPQGFDRELFVSDGSNLSGVFDAGNYRQANFRLARLGGENFISDWDQWVNLVTSLTNAADSIHGIPLLITKVKFTVALPNVNTFFMAALAAENIFYQDITIINSPAFQLSADPVERILLQVEGTTVEIDPVGNTPLRFSSTGEKTLRLKVQFASGFVGENLFRVIVGSLNK